MLKVEKLLNELIYWAESERPLDIVVQGVEQGRGLMMNRVFNSEKGTKDVKGKGLGSYSNSYAQTRQKKGLQSKVIDFTFTESLFRDVKLVRNGQQISVAVLNVNERKKVGYLEKRYNANIFDFSKGERDNVLKVIKFNMDKDFESITNEYL
jgi:hypothetical protein